MLSYDPSESLIIKSNSQLYGNLYVGGYDALKCCKEKKIGAILSAVWIGSQFKCEAGVVHLIIEAQDMPQYEMNKHFDDAAEFIQFHLKKTNVLVHCAAGISRSVSLVIAYYIKILQQNPNEALNEIRTKRSFAKPNEGFMKQLYQYYNELYNKK